MNCPPNRTETYSVLYLTKYMFFTFFLIHLCVHVGAHNPYQSMILSAGKILEHYDTDKKYPVFGFGAKVR